MCFTPKISLATTIIEFFVVAWLYFHYPRTKLMKFFAFLLIFLGLYQFSEFMLCVSDDIQTWGKFGFLVYTLIPAGSLILVASLENFQKKYLLFLIPPLLFLLFAIFDKNFITYGVCNTLFVTIRNRFFSYDTNLATTVLYTDYYILYIALTCVFLFRKIKKSKSKKENFIYYLMIVTIPLAIVPPLIFIIIFPAFYIVFPSIYCHFAMIITLTAIISLHYENKIIN